ncbi:MAG: hypothetical protein KC636_16890 [Myxococcales bacterium]|nr:hypothetical protein [Myxococcales bacterium]
MMGLSRFRTITRGGAPRRPSPSVTAVVLIAALLGCEDDGLDVDDVEELTCAFGATLSGAIDHELALEEIACGYATGHDVDLINIYAPVDGVVDTIAFEILEVSEGAVGTFPARISVALADGRTFDADDCEVDVSTHEPAEGPDGADLHYQVRGLGSCSAPAVDAESTMTVTISEFAFATPTAWRP